MWIVRIALSRPYTFIVLALLILLVSPLVILRTPTDIFPNIDIPVLASVWNYAGLSAEEMEGRITTGVERSMTTTVSNIEHIESVNVSGRAIIKIFLQPGASVDTANARVTAISQSRSAIAAGRDPAVHPDLQCLHRPDSAARALEHDAAGIAAQGSGQNFMRTQLVTVPGAAAAVSIWRQAARR